jgi:hypothetical protein
MARVNLYQGFLNVGVLSTDEGGVYAGLIGNLDGNPSNDMLPRGGNALICPVADNTQLLRFGDSWRLTVEETLLRAELPEDGGEVLVTDESGMRISLQTAVLEVMQLVLTQTTTTEISISVVLEEVATRYGVTQSQAFYAMREIFVEQELTSVTQVFQVSVLLQVVEVYAERMTTTDIETLDVTVRAFAQQACAEAGVEDPLALANCVVDVAITEDPTYVESAVSFQQTIETVQIEERVGASVEINVYVEQVVLPQPRVIEIISTVTTPPVFYLGVERVAELEVEVVGNITSEFNAALCSEEDIPHPRDLLEEQPLARGVAIFCATHARGWTWSGAVDDTLEVALEKALSRCEAAAETRVSRAGPVMMPCQLVGTAVREVEGGVIGGGSAFDIQIITTEKRVIYEEVPDGFDYVPEPVPGVTADCMEGDYIPLEGLQVIEGLLEYVDGEESTFDDVCTSIEMTETDEDFLLSAICSDGEGGFAESAISLLAAAAIVELIEHPNCAPEPEPVPEPEPEQPEPPVQPEQPEQPEQCEPERDTTLVPELPPLSEAPKTFSSDGLQTDIPARGDFVFLRSLDGAVQIHARRDLWVADLSQSVFTAFTVEVGGSVLEVHAAPEASVTIDGEPVVELYGSLPLGDGSVTFGGESLMIVELAESSFILMLQVFAGSHVVPVVAPDPAHSYEGLVRFTEHWLTEEAPFSVPAEPEPECACGG